MKKQNSCVFGKILLAIFTIAFLSCSSKPEQGIIKGNLKNFQGGYVYLDEITLQSSKTKDSVKVDDKGNFTLKFNTKEPSFYRIRLAENNYILLIVNDKEQIDFSADANNLGKTAQVCIAGVIQQNDCNRKCLHKKFY